MAIVRTQIIVDKCVDCPFYARTAVHALVEMFAKEPRPRSGLCKYNNLGQPLLVGVQSIADESAPPPANCPLRSSDVLVTLRGAS